MMAASVIGRSPPPRWRKSTSTRPGEDDDYLLIRDRRRRLSMTTLATSCWKPNSVSSMRKANVCCWVDMGIPCESSYS